MQMSDLIKLDYPLENGFSTIKMRRPKVRDMLASDKMKASSDAEKEIALFANLCEISPEEISNLDLKDYQKLQECYKNFLS
jgi:hypothetical protein